jgi:impB/mucB/samB family C-terminal domain
MKELVAAVGQRHAHFVYGVCRGLDDSQVIQRQKAKTLLAAKNFECSHDVDVAVWWLKILARELVERMSYEEKQHNRYSRTLTCSYRLFSLASNGFTNISRTQTMPGANVKNRVDAIVELGRRELLKAIESGIDHRLPISFVSLTGSNFYERALGKVGTLLRTLSLRVVSNFRCAFVF